MGKKLFKFKIFISLVIIVLTVFGNNAQAGDLVAKCTEENKMLNYDFLEKFVKDTFNGNAKVCEVHSGGDGLNLFKGSAKPVSISQVNSASIIFVGNLTKQVKFNKPTFALDCKSLKYCPDCFGVFFWKNGRPMVVLFEEVIKRQGLKIPSKYNKYIDSKQYLSCM